jgi:hypothetical protein
MVSLKGKYLIPLPNIFWAGLNTFGKHFQCGAKLAREGVIVRIGDVVCHKSIKYQVDSIK